MLKKYVIINSKKHSITVKWIKKQINCTNRIEHPCRDFLLFSFCFGGWITTLIAASKIAFTFCSQEASQQIAQATNVLINRFIPLQSNQRKHYTENTKSFTLQAWKDQGFNYLLCFWAAFYIISCTNLFPQFLPLLWMNHGSEAN